MPGFDVSLTLFSPMHPVTLLFFVAMCNCAWPSPFLHPASSLFVTAAAGAGAGAGAGPKLGFKDQTVHIALPSTFS